MGKLYENILALCEATNVSARAMCIGAGVPGNLMTELKKGRKETISAATAQKIADYFGVDVGVVLNGQKEKPAETGELASVGESGKKEPAANAADSLDVSMLTEEERGKVAAFMAGLISARQKP